LPTISAVGSATYALGSNDQTMPWFYGLWRYVRSGLDDEATQQRIIAKMTEVADVLESTAWRIPAVPPFDFRGTLGALWKPQQTNNEAEKIAALQLKEINRLSPARRAELRSAREAMFAAWVVTLCPDRAFVKQHEPEILATLAHFRADKLRFVSFFPMECAWWRLQVAG